VIDRHVAISREIEDLLVDNRWTTREKVLRLPNAVTDVPDSGPRPPDPTPFTVGTIANFRPQKDHETLLRAWRRFRDGYPDSRLIWVGDGPTRPAAEALARELGVSETVEFRGFVEHPGDIYPEFDLFALSTHFEGQCLVLLEAMSYRLPVVCTDLTSTREVVQDGERGLLVPEQDAEGFSEKLLSLARDPETRARLGASAREHVLAGHRMESWVAGLRKLYEAM
jgi:glycosyltransferase involved in cell wall biosynthesis